MKKWEARKKLAETMERQAIEQGSDVTRADIEWLIDTESELSDEDLASMIGEGAVVVFRTIVAKIS